MRIIVTGASGLVGSALVPSLIADGHSVTRLVRHRSTQTLADGTSQVHWNPETGEIDAERLEAHDAAVHLAGESIGEGRWTDEKKALIRDSRVKGTRLLAETLARLKARPKVLVSASAVGFYGNRGAEMLDEESAAGDGFLSEVCRAWEEAAGPARAAGIRVVHPRIGVLLSKNGGALPKMLTPFRMGAGGKIGGGDQYWSWITIDDLVGIIKFAITHESLTGPINAITPHPVTNAEFTKTLGHVLNRPALFPVPAFAVRLVFGEMADAVLLSSARVVPKRLQSANYRFAYPELEGALRHVLKEQSPDYSA